ncbi:HAD-like protein [Venturia nashicola]|uniref:Mitochondrial import inner membrane translocase subunit TIM50 n=1 Tax=Venturia nashicola TaxID=86259 RepID=A0A4Z1P1A2_9PEZI|nr:HAD-like protein [Venturia nashicola]TLD31752.1 HAD-like protein [Venturia nashicola]
MSASHSSSSSTITTITTITGPRPSKRYLEQSEIAALRFENTKFPLLVVLDLNGCLVVRQGPVIELREHVKPFLEYLLEEHYVMFWSSATTASVKRMVDKLLTPEQQTRVVAIWNRSHFNLTPEQYNSKIQLYKKLSGVWESEYIQQQHPFAGLHPWAQWNHHNTILIDDSEEKARHEPYNHICIPELFRTEDPNKPHLPLNPGTTVLSQVAGYLDWLKHSCNVTNSIKKEEFVLNDQYNLNWQEFWAERGRMEFEWDEAEAMEDWPPREE